MLVLHHFLILLHSFLRVDNFFLLVAFYDMHNFQISYKLQPFGFYISYYYINTDFQNGLQKTKQTILYTYNAAPDFRYTFFLN